MKIGDLVKYNWRSKNPKNLLGLIVEDSLHYPREDVEYKNVWWMLTGRISPIKVAYLEVVSEGR